MQNKLKLHVNYLLFILISDCASATAGLLGLWVRIPPLACMVVSCVSCVVRQRSMRRGDHSSRGVLPSVVCLSVIVKPSKGRPWPGIGSKRRRWGGILISDAITYLLTPWCRVLLEKLTGLQLVKKFPAFHGTRRFFTTLTSVRHLSLSWASPIQSIYPHPISWRSILIHPSTPRSPQWSLSLRFPHQDHIRPPLLTHTRHMPSPSHSSRWVRSTDHLAPRYAVSSIPPLPGPP